MSGDGAAAPPRPARLVLAAWVGAAEGAVHLAALVGWADRRPPLLLAALALKLVFCVGTARRGPGSALALMLWEVSTVLAYVAGGLAPVAKAAASAVSVAVVALVLSSLHAFPEPALPRRG